MDERRLVPLASDALISDRDYVGVVLHECSLPVQTLNGVALEGSLLSRVRGPGVCWSHLRLNDVVLRDCDFSNAAWEKPHGARLELSKCRLTGWNVADGVFRHVQFQGCKINLAFFHGALLTDCRFQNCDLTEADFQGAKLKNVTFRRCDLRCARFAAAALNAVDFRGSHLTGTHLEPDRLRGNVFDPSQMLDLAGVLGLVVKEVEATE